MKGNYKGNESLKSVLITSRLGKTEGYTNGEIVYFDLYDQKSQREVRHFIILKQCVKLMYEPFGWKDTWYIDLIQIQYISDTEMQLNDFYLDIIINNKNKNYKIIDFDDLANALVEGKVTALDLEIPLKGFQTFLDQNIYRHVFPPLEIRPFLERC
jgi:Protein of unknown function (DUF402)